MTKKTDRQSSNENDPFGKIDTSLSATSMDASLRALIQDWLDRGVPEERIADVTFGVTKDLAYHSLTHRQDNPGDAFERYQQVSAQAGVLDVIQALTRERFIKALSAED